MKTCTTCGTEWPDETKFCPSDGTTLRSAQAGASLLGSVLADRYHIIEKLGEGGMGAVYLGEHVKMGRRSAIKVMTQALSQDPDAIARFNREAANAARINHPNVCGIYDFGETSDGTIFLAMELIEGESLTDLLKREAPLGLHRATALLRQTADALQAAHDLGIVHRDLKPDNIMIARARNGSDLVKVVDFGIAKAMGGEEGQKVTRTGLVVGTPEYMSPEQLSGDVMDGRSDVYSLALVFFRILTGVLPFQAESAQEVMIKRLTDEPTKLEDALPGGNFPPRLQQVMDHVLQRMPTDRFESADAFAQAVIQVVSGSAGGDVAEKTEEVDVAATQLIDAGDSAATEILEKTVAADAFKAEPTQPPQATPETPMPVASPAEKTGKKKPVMAIAASIAVLAVGGGAATWALRGGNGTEPDTTQGGQPVVLANRPLDSSDTQGSALPGSEGTPGGQAGLDSNGDGRIGATVGDSVILTGDTTARGSSSGEDKPIAVSDPPPEEGTAPEVTAARIQVTIDSLIEPIFEVETWREARDRARTLFNDGATTDTLKAKIAYMLAQSYSFDVDMGDLMCLWSDRAVENDPTNELHRKFKRDNCNQ